MGFFLRNFDPPVSENALLARKKGMARIFELLGRDLGAYFKAGVLAFLSLLPYIIGVGFAIAAHAVLQLLLAGVIGGMIAAPQVCGAADTLLRSMRDEVGWWWGTYRRAWKRNVKASLAPGAVFGLISAIQIFVLFHLNVLEKSIGDLFVLAASAIFTAGLMSYYIPMLVLLNLSAGSLLKNSVVLFLGHLPRTLLAAFIQLAWSALILLFFPYSMILLFFCSFWFPYLLAFSVVYPILDGSFGIEDAISDLQKQ